MMALEQAREYLEQLGLTEAAAALDNRLDLAAQRKLSYPEVLSDLLGIEAAARRERYLKTRTRLAHLPFHRTLEEFDFGFQPSIDESQVRELASLTFVSQAANLVLLGPPGVGKTHLAVALGLEAISRGYGAYFVRAYHLMEDLRKAQEEHRLDRRLRVYLAPQGADHRRVWYLALRPSRGHRLLYPGLSQVRAGQHHPDFQQGLRRMGRAPGRLGHRRGHPGPAAPSQSCPQHPWGELQTRREADCRTVGRSNAPAPSGRHDAFLPRKPSQGPGGGSKTEPALVGQILVGVDNDGL